MGSQLLLYSISKFKILMLLVLLANTKGQAAVIAEISDTDLSAKAHIQGVTIPFNALFSMTVVLNKDSRSADLIDFEAVMPAHNHGMVLKPKITRMGSREWRIDGLKLHMKGNWKLIFEWQGNGKKNKTTYDIVI